MYRVEISSNPDSTFRVKSPDYEFVIDTKGRGITPPDTLLAGLGSCIGVYLRKYCEGSALTPLETAPPKGGASDTCDVLSLKGLTLDDFKITVEAEFSKERPVGFKEINVSIDLKGAQLDERRKAGLLEFIKNCPIHNTLKMNPAISVKIT